jgi:SPX domain protein involved in polyphosphate accumulation
MVEQEQGYTALRTFRYERKFLVEDLMPCQVAALIKQHPRLFRVPYPARFVNNLYLDTPEMDNYYDNVGGAERRRKVRVRWYGEAFGRINKPILEIKIKQGLVGTKQSHPLAPFRVDAHFCDRVFQRMLSVSNLPPLLRLDLRNLQVVLLNRYHRHYYATQDGAFRVTLDTKLAFYKANGIFGNQFVHHQVNGRNVVVELKYENEQEPHANRVAGYFPFRVTRNSKYVEGIERVYF